MNKIDTRNNVITKKIYERIFPFGYSVNHILDMILDGLDQ